MPEHFSRRSNWPAESGRISELLETYRQSGTEWLDLTASNPTRCGLDLWDAASLTPLTEAANLVYDPHPKGQAKARKVIADYYAAKGAAVDPDQIILTSGTSEAYNLALRLLTHPGQNVLTPAPSYPLIDLLLDLNDIRQDRYQLRCDGAVTDPLQNGWSFNAASARLARQSQTPVLIAIHANNPTGHTFSPDERAALIEFARTEKMALIVDEVFLDYSARPNATFASEEKVLTLTLSGISKILGLPQMKLSWVVVSGPPEERCEALRRLEIMADIFLSVNTPAQNALGCWMALAPQIQARIQERVTANRAALAKLLGSSAGLRPLPCAGAWTAIVQLPDGTDDESFAHDLLKNSRVLTHPGYLFDFASGSHLVLSLLPPPEVFEEGLRRIIAAV